MSLIFETQDEFGVISVYDDGKYRILSFAEGDEQSRVQIKSPHVLQHEYTQAMLLALTAITALPLYRWYNGTPVIPSGTAALISGMYVLAPGNNL